MADIALYEDKVRVKDKKISYTDDICEDIPRIYYYNFWMNDIRENPTYKKSSHIKIGDVRYIVNDRLSHIARAIEKSKYILNLKDDWDTDGAIAIEKDVYNKAMSLIIDYSEAVLAEYSVIMKAPKITAGRDGSIDIDWKNDNAELLITVLNTPDFNVDYYGDDGYNNTVIKGYLAASINEDLLFWMRKLK